MWTHWANPDAGPGIADRVSAVWVICREWGGLQRIRKEKEEASSGKLLALWMGQGDLVRAMRSRPGGAARFGVVWVKSKHLACQNAQVNWAARRNRLWAFLFQHGRGFGGQSAATKPCKIYRLCGSFMRQVCTFCPIRCGPDPHSPAKLVQHLAADPHLLACIGQDPELENVFNEISGRIRDRRRIGNLVGSRVSQRNRACLWTVRGSLRLM